MPCGYSSLAPLASVIVTVPALAVSVLAEKPSLSSPSSRAPIASFVPVAALLAGALVVLAAPAEVAAAVVAPPDDFELPHAASVPPSSSSAAASGAKRRTVVRDTAMGASSGSVSPAKTPPGADPSLGVPAQCECACTGAAAARRRVSAISATNTTVASALSTTL